MTSLGKIDKYDNCQINALNLRDELLHEQNKNNNCFNTCICPNIDITIENIKTSALYDSGSEITCISEQFYQNNLNNFKNCAKLPINGKIAKGAIKGKSVHIQTQLICDIKIGEFNEEIIVIIVPNLERNFIIGYDTIKSLKWILDPDTEEIISKSKGYKIQYMANNQISCDIRLSEILYEDSEFKKNKLDDNFPQEITYLEIIDKLKINEEINESQRRQMADLIYEYRKVFSFKPGLVKNFEYKLKITNDEPYHVKPYPIPLKYQKAVESEIEKMLESGVISRSTSTFINPVVTALKPNGSIRFCLDARELNKRMEGDRETSPGIEEILMRCEGVKIMTSMDLTSSFWQIPLAKESRKYTAFMVNGRVYEYNVVPFGLKNATSALLRGLEKPFSPLKFLLTYIDDMLLLSKTFEEHIHHLKIVFERLLEYNITINFQKCNFLQKEAKFLGNIISSEGIRQDPKKLEKIKNIKRPRNKKQLQSLLGFFNFNAKYVEKHAEEWYPLLQLTRKGVPFTWKKIHQDCLDKSIEKFVKEMTLAYPNLNKPYILSTDASGYAISAILSQLDDDGVEKIILCASRILKGPELNYFITEKEMLAIVWALRKFSAYLLGSSVKVRTDHKAITFFNKCRFANNRIMRWILATQDYDIEFEYIKGKLNTAADMLSRNPDDEMEVKKEDKIYISSLLEISPSKKLINDIKNLAKIQSENEKLKIIFESLKNKDEKLSKIYSIHKNILYKKFKSVEKILIPETLAKEIAIELHTMYAHIGPKKIYKMIIEDFLCKGLRRKINEWLKTCETCQKVKYKNIGTKAPLQIIEVQRPNQLLSIDFIGPLPKARAGLRYVLVCLDAFSKYVALYPLKHATTNAVINKIFNDYIKNHGKPERIQCDHGTQFTSPKWIEKLEKEKITCTFSSIRHPQSNIVERCNKELKRLFRTLVDEKHGAWILYVKMIEKILNEIHHETTEYTPLELHKNIKPTRFWTKFFPKNEDNLPHNYKISLARERILNKRKKYNAKVNNGRVLTSYNIGDLVLVKSAHQSSADQNTIASFFNVYDGPYTLLQKLNDTTYRLGFMNSKEYKGMYHVNDLKKFVTS